MREFKRERRELQMRKHDEAMASLHAPGKDWILFVRRRFSMGENIYSVGCTVDAEAFAKTRHWRHLLQNHYVEWQMGNSDIKRPSPIPIAPSPPPTPKPTIEIVPGPDAVMSWRKSLKLMTDKLNGDRVKAEDLLLSIPAGSNLHSAATRQWAERRSRQSGESFRRIPEGVNG